MFDGHGHRLAMARACSERPVAWSELGRVGGQREANGRETGRTLCRWGVLQEVLVEGRSHLRLNPAWASALEESELRASCGTLDTGATLLLVARAGTPAFYRLLASPKRVNQRLAWIARLPHHSAFGLIAVVNPGLNEDAIERLATELHEAGVDHERLALGKLAGHPDLRDFALHSLPETSTSSR